MENKYYIMRHGEALLNKKGLVSCWPEKIYCPLTPKGKKQAKIAGRKLKSKKIDLIFSSDLLRCKQTAEIVGQELGIKPRYDKRLREFNLGVFNGKLLKEANQFFGTPIKKFTIRAKNAENYTDLKKRMFDFLKSIDKKYSKKTILIISHEAPLTMLVGAVKGWSNQKILDYRKRSKLKPGEFRKLIL
ncbi:MAG: histidine phosphatase family protein [Candidatus Pacebacteria bacterium]|nr:histidine phosphatase family protein [Candidatus Paceibacterota bacterium]